MGNKQGSPAAFAKAAISLAIRRFGLPGELEATAFVDGYGDLGIDGLAVALGDTAVTDPDDIAAGLAIEGQALDLLFVQSKRPGTIKQDDIVLFGNAVRTFLTIEEDELKRLKPSEQLMAQWRLFRDLRRAKPDIVEAADITLLFVYGGQWHDFQTVNVRRENVRADIGKALPKARIEFEIWGVEQLDDIGRQYGPGSVRKLTKTALLPMPPGATSGFIGYVAAQSLVDFVSSPPKGKKTKGRKADDFMFVDNVRAFIGVDQKQAERENPGAVGLKTTLERKGNSTVIAGHNGIVIVADKANQTGDVVELTNAQVVNGCQSSHVLVANSGRLDSCYLPVKIVVTEDEALKDIIAIASNTQAEVDSYDILARLPNVKTLVLEFSRAAVPLHERVWFQRRRNEPVDFPDNWQHGDWMRVVRPRHLLDAFAATIAGIPDVAHAEPRKIVDLARGGIAFHPEHDPMLYRALAWMIVTGRRWARRHNRKWQDRFEYSGGQAYAARHHYISALWHLVDPHPDAMGLPDIDRSRPVHDRFSYVIGKLLDDGDKIGDLAGRVVDGAVPSGRHLNAELVRTKAFTAEVIAAARKSRSAVA